MEEKSMLKPVVLRDSLKINFIILQIFGWWPPEGEDAAADFKRKLYLIYRMLVLSSTYIFDLFTETMSVIISLRNGNLEQLSNSGFLCLTHLSGSVKLYCFISRNKSLIELVNSLQQPTFQPKNKRQLNHIEHHMYYSRFYYLFLLGCCIGSCILLSAYPLMDTWSAEKPMELPFSIWYPFDVTYSPMFECVFVYQALAIIINCFTIISCDGSYSTHMAHVCAQLDNLNDSLEFIVEYAEGREIKRCAEDYENLELMNDCLQKEVEDGLVRCIAHHRNIHEYVNKLGEIYTYCILAQLSLGVVVLCFSLFQLTMVRFNTYEFYSLLSYFICVVIETSTFCYYSNEILIKSGQLPLSAYKSDWIRCNAAYKNKLRTFMLCTQEPMKLYAGNFFVLSLQTLLNILRMSWSYFAVLHKVHQN